MNHYAFASSNLYGRLILVLFPNPALDAAVTFVLDITRGLQY